VVIAEVGNAPKIRSPLADVSATAGRPLLLECDISLGRPKAEIRWYDNNITIIRIRWVEFSISQGFIILQLVLINLPFVETGSKMLRKYTEARRIKCLMKMVLPLSVCILLII